MESNDPFLPKISKLERIPNHIDPDKVMLALGKFAKYQSFVCFLINFSWYIVAVEVMTMAFVTETPPFYCQKTYESGFDLSELRNFTNQCEISISNKSETCGINGTDAIFDEHFGETLVSEWNMICDSANYAQLGTSIYMIGGMIAILPIGQLSDKLGRKWIFMMSCWITFCLIILSSFSPSHTIFLIIRFFMGVSSVGLQAVSWIYSCEIVAPEFRIYMTIMANVLWTVGYCLVGILAIYIKDWRWLIFVTALPTLITFVYYWFLQESLYWLVARNHIDQAYKWIDDACRKNRVKVDIQKCLIIRHDDETKEKRHLGHVFKSGVLTFHILISCYIMFAGSLVYWGLSLFSTKLSKDRYTGFILSGLIEFPAGLFGPLLLIWFGRKTIGIWSCLISGLALVALVFVPETAPDWITLVLGLTGKFGNMLIWCSTDLLVAELLPTTVRNSAYGVISTVSKIGSVVAPYAGVLGEYDRRLPPGVFGVLSLIAAALHFCYPETKGKELPEDIEDTDKGPFLSIILKTDNLA